jgi:hypothetical protein
MEARLCAHDNSMCESDGVSAMSAIRELNFAPKGGGRLPLPERCSLDLSCFEEPEVQDALAVAIEEILYVVTFSGIDLQALDGVTVTSDCRAAACALQDLPQGQVPLEMNPQPEGEPSSPSHVNNNDLFLEFASNCSMSDLACSRQSKSKQEVPVYDLCRGSAEVYVIYPRQTPVFEWLWLCSN